MPLADGLAFRPITRQRATELRRAGGVPYVADAAPGYPCRQCLRDAEIGDELILVSHDPFTGDSPYRSASPIFLHRDDCGEPDLTDVPQQLAVRSLSLHAFDADEMMLDAALVDGAALADSALALFERADVVAVHVHNQPRGCWATSIERSP
ncbi:MAG: DUF1203 domain-containing protein [Actinomycetota bacterium]